MTANPKDQIAGEISALRSKLNTLEKSTRLVEIRDAVEDMQTAVNGFRQKISGLRSRGYVFGKGLEAQADQLLKQWTRMSAGVMAQINQQAARLQNAFAPVRQRSAGLSGGNMAQARTLLNQLKPQVDSIEAQVRAAESQLKGTYDSFKNQVDALERRLRNAGWALAQLEEATFKPLATEAVVAVVTAVFVKDGSEDKEDPDGVLFLTDQRLIFEQKEEITTKKILFIPLEKKKVQKVQFDAPVELVKAVNTSKKGLFKNQDNIEVVFAPGAPAEKALFHIWQECTEWQALINRVKSGDIDKDRAVALDVAAEAKVKSAPSQCPSCGGNITQVILRGQDNIKCEYCGLMIRL